jgi:predicted dienelactone hydrolase
MMLDRKKELLMKRNLVLLLILSLMALFAFGCDQYASVCTGSARVSGASSATLYYPCTGGPYPATTLTSGFMGTKSAVAWLARDAAAAGYVVLAMTPSNPMGMVGGWRTAHVNGVRHLKTLSGRVDPNKVGTCGHSKGGGGAL